VSTANGGSGHNSKYSIRGADKIISRTTFHENPIGKFYGFVKKKHRLPILYGNSVRVSVQILFEIILSVHTVNIESLPAEKINKKKTRSFQEFQLRKNESISESSQVVYDN
jgi:hypothetical protein